MRWTFNFGFKNGMIKSKKPKILFQKKNFIYQKNCLLIIYTLFSVSIIFAALPIVTLPYLRVATTIIHIWIHNIECIVIPPTYVCIVHTEYIRVTNTNTIQMHIYLVIRVMSLPQWAERSRASSKMNGHPERNTSHPSSLPSW